MNSGDHLRIDTTGLRWEPTATSGIENKTLAPYDTETHRATSLIRLAPGTLLDIPPADHGLEAFVVKGLLTTEQGVLEANGYLRQPPRPAGSISTATGCTLLLKTGPFDEEDRDAVHIQTGDLPWLPGQGGLQVKPLHTFGSEGTALVHWPPGERFVPHQHWGGEEILVLSGVFQDEHGRYPEGTWLRSPHLSAHHPFVEEETVIFVKTGHLPMVEAPDTQARDGVS